MFPGRKAGAAASDARPLSQSAGFPPARQYAGSCCGYPDSQDAGSCAGYPDSQDAGTRRATETFCRAPAPRFRAVKTIRTRKTFHAPTGEGNPRRTARSA